jgi:hypothetical protein
MNSPIQFGHGKRKKATQVRATGGFGMKTIDIAAEIRQSKDDLLSTFKAISANEPSAVIARACRNYFTQHPRRRPAG